VIKFVQSLNEDALYQEFLLSTYPKWGTLCLLRYLKLRTLECALITPGTDPISIFRAIETFMDGQQIDRVLVRTDGGKEKQGYLRGGNSFDSERARSFVQNVIDTRAVLLMTPTNRFTNTLSVNLGMDRTGVFIIEVLGAGFDVSDLNRGVTPPALSLRCTNVDWDTFEYPSKLLIERRENADVITLRALRLKRLGEELLPAIGINVQGDPAVFAESWLLQKGYGQLLNCTTPHIGYKDICKFYEVAYLIVSAYGKTFRWKQISVSCSQHSGGEEWTYWDIVDPQRKFVLKFEC